MVDNVCVYIADPSLFGSRHLDKFSEIKSYRSLSMGKQATGLILELESTTLELNLLPSDKIKEHLEGLRGFAINYALKQEDVTHILSRIYEIQMVIGCIIKPGFDDKGQVLDFIKRFSSSLNSLLFYNNSLLDYDGKCLSMLK